jgi:tRNA(His) 5'-end guanylyltransferase
MKDERGDRMKAYERMAGSKICLIPKIPAIARLDGKAFHSFTKGLERPFCSKLHDTMVRTTKYLVEQTNANIGYTQSDEITLVWGNQISDDHPELMFGGRRNKLVSVLAAMCAVFFNKELAISLPNKVCQMPLFDCRVWNVPTMAEAVECLSWREADCTRNSISMAAQAYFSHHELQGKKSTEMQELLFQKRGVNWNNYQAAFKRGTYIQKVSTCRKFTAAEIEILPPKHAARTNPDLEVTRRYVSVIAMPPINKVINAADVVFYGAKPQTRQEEEIKCKK